MSVRDIGVVLLKLWGLISLVNGALAALQLPWMVIGRVEGADRLVWLTVGLSASVNLILGVVLLTSAERIVALIVPHRDGGDETATTTSYTAADLQSLVLGGAGAFLAISALRDIAQLSYAILREPAWDPSGTWAYTLQDQQGQLVGALVQLIFAVALVLGRRGLAAVWARVHPMGSS